MSNLETAAEAAETDAETDVNVPSAFVCPITLRVMERPVVCSDGHSYEEAAICRWLDVCVSPRSPMTNEPLESTALVPNIALRRAIAEWREERSHEARLRRQIRVQINNLQRDVAETQFWVGWRYHSKLDAGVSGDAATAAAWYWKAAEKGHKKAQFWLACMYYDGEGVAQDRALAARLYVRAGTGPDACSDAQLRLGYMHHVGAGVERDIDAAREWYARSARQGNADAQYCLATVYDAVDGDDATAREWYEKAARQGHAAALVQVGGGAMWGAESPTPPLAGDDVFVTPPSDERWGAGPPTPLWGSAPPTPPSQETMYS